MNPAFTPPVIAPGEVFAKSDLGRIEIQNRQLGLAPMLRRLLILIDGQRTAQELSALLAGQDINGWLTDLVRCGCIATTTPGRSELATVSMAAVTTSATDAAPVAASSSVPAALPRPTVAPETLPGSLFLEQLPPPETRSAKQTELARNVMTNTVNTVYQPYTRLTLLEAIAAARTAVQARAVFLKWEESLGQSAVGAKRLPEFRAKLFPVL